jgi:hypothetical protein
MQFSMDDRNSYIHQRAIDPARVRAFELFVANPLRSAAEIADLLDEEGLDASIAKIRVWKARDRWNDNLSVAAARSAAKAVSTVLTIGDPMSDRALNVAAIELLEEPYKEYLSGCAKLARAFCRWAERIKPDEITMADGIKIAEVIPIALKTMSILRQASIEARATLSLDVAQDTKRFDGEVTTHRASAGPHPALADTIEMLRQHVRGR